jgi:hypothetical protein
MSLPCRVFDEEWFEVISRVGTEADLKSILIQDATPHPMTSYHRLIEANLSPS